MSTETISPNFAAALDDLEAKRKEALAATRPGGSGTPPEDPADQGSPFEDIGAYLDGVAKAIVPTVAPVMGETCLFYDSAINEIHGEPSVGKTNILLCAAKAVLESGGAVVFLDPEDTPARIIPRALSLGLCKEAMRQRFHYLRSPQPTDYDRIQAWAVEAKPELVILDGLAEGLAAEGLNENVPMEVLQFFHRRMKPFAEAGAAVVVADHVVKNAESRNLASRGSGAKAGHYKGVSYDITLGQGYTTKEAGFVRFKVAKDGNGCVGPKGTLVAELHFSPCEENELRTNTEWRKPALASDFRPTGIMDKIVSHLRTFPDATKRDLRGLGKKAAHVDQAVEILLAEGTITRRTVGSSHKFRLAETSPEEQAEATWNPKENAA